MKEALRELLADVKAAARLGEPEGIGVALADLLDWPEVKGNLDMESAFVQQALAPLGRALDQPPVPTRLLVGMAQDALAAFRAIAAVPLCGRALAGDGDARGALESLASDARPEVRHAITLTLRDRRNEPAVQVLLAEWEASGKPKWQAIAAEAGG
ncbi:MAG: hypothetical protein EPO32_12660 [Anaerolineae bacterium]|nr:MAG: hypothetical protein EPO32_12660 [Anaerolineae bacterium]